MPLARAAERKEVVRIRSAARSVISVILHAAGDLEAALATYELAAADAGRSEDDHRLALVLGGRGLALAQLGRLPEAFTSLERARVMLEEMEDTVCLAHTLNTLATLHERDGNDQAAAEARQEAKELFRTVGRSRTQTPYRPAPRP